jgi:hypothetical protein
MPTTTARRHDARHRRLCVFNPALSVERRLLPQEQVLRRQLRLRLDAE